MEEYTLVFCADRHNKGNDDNYEVNMAVMREIRKIWPDHLIDGGDDRDKFDASEREIMDTKTEYYWNKLYSELLAHGKNVTIMGGNHNHNPNPANYPFGVNFCKRLVVGDVEFLHGHEFDITWTGIGWIPGVDRIAFWLCDNHPGLAIRVRRWISKIGRMKSPREEKRDGDWSRVLHLQVILARAHQRACRHNQIEVIGHIHETISYLMGGKKVLSPGAIEDGPLFMVFRFNRETMELIGQESHG